MILVCDMSQNELYAPVKWFKEQILRCSDLHVIVRHTYVSALYLAQVTLPRDLVQPRNGKHTYLIEISQRTTDWNQYLISLMHELVHVQQHHERRLQVQHDYTRIWLQSKYECGKTHQDYFNRPWEIEARKRQTALAEMFLDGFVHPINRRK